jgi:hypothetical protein
MGKSEIDRAFTDANEATWRKGPKLSVTLESSAFTMSSNHQALHNPFIDNEAMESDSEGEQSWDDQGVEETVEEPNCEEEGDMVIVDED